MSQSLQETLSSKQQAQNCIGQIGYHYQVPEVRYVHSDCAVDQVENGFILTIKGKKYVAMCPQEVAELIREKLIK